MNENYIGLERYSFLVGISYRTLYERCRIDKISSFSSGGYTYVFTKPCQWIMAIDEVSKHLPTLRFRHMEKLTKMKDFGDPVSLSVFVSYFDNLKDSQMDDLECLYYVDGDFITFQLFKPQQSNPETKKLSHSITQQK